MASSKSASKRDGGAPPAAVVVRRFDPPAGFDWVVFAGVALYFSCFALVRAGAVEPGTPAWELLEAVGASFLKGGGGADFFRWLVDAIFVPVLAIHVTEVWWLDRTRLAPHGVARGGRLWWLWMGSCFFEGVRAFSRFDRAVEQLRGAT